MTHFSWKYKGFGGLFMATGWFWIQIVIAGIGGFLGWFLGGLDGFMYTLVAFVMADYITGVFCAVHDRALSSKVGWRGVFRKVAIFLLVGAGHLLDKYVLGHDHIVRTAIIFFYLSHEGLSLLENCKLSCPPRCRGHEHRMSQRHPLPVSDRPRIY